MLLVQATRAVLPGGVLVDDGPIYVLVDGTSIVSVQRERPSVPEGVEEKRAHLVTPGFVDIHTHGLGGASDVLDYWTNPGYTQALLPRTGTTSFLASVVFSQSSSSSALISEKILHELGECIGRTDRGAVLEGVHAEGPIVNDCGALPSCNTDMSLEDFTLLLDKLPSLRVMTISPHLEAQGGYKKISALLERGVLPSLGHDKVAREDEVLGALKLTHRPLHITHIFNVSSFHHRNPSLVNFGLTDKYPNTSAYTGVTPPTVEIVGDMAHVHPLTVSALLKSRSFTDVCFVTDAVFHHSNVPGESIDYCGRKVFVSKDCKTMVVEDSKTIAGSCCSMLDILYNLTNVLSVPLGQAVAMLSETPARIAGLDHVGQLKAGKRADILLFDENLTLTETMVAGTAYRS